MQKYQEFFMHLAQIGMTGFIGNNGQDYTFFRNVDNKLPVKVVLTLNEAPNGLTNVNIAAYSIEVARTNNTFQVLEATRKNLAQTSYELELYEDARNNALRFKLSVELQVEMLAAKYNYIINNLVGTYTALYVQCVHNSLEWVDSLNLSREEFEENCTKNFSEIITNHAIENLGLSKKDAKMYAAIVAAKQCICNKTLFDDFYAMLIMSEIPLAAAYELVNQNMMSTFMHDVQMFAKQ